MFTKLDTFSDMMSSKEKTQQAIVRLKVAPSLTSPEFQPRKRQNISAQTWSTMHDLILVTMQRLLDDVKSMEHKATMGSIEWQKIGADTLESDEFVLWPVKGEIKPEFQSRAKFEVLFHD